MKLLLTWKVPKRVYQMVGGGPNTSLKPGRICLETFVSSLALTYPNDIAVMLLQQKPSTPETPYTPLQKLAPTPAGHLVNLTAFYPHPMSIKAKSCTQILWWDLQ